MSCIIPNFFIDLKHIKPRVTKLKFYGNARSSFIQKTSNKLRLGLLEKKRKRRLQSHTDYGELVSAPMVKMNPTRTKKKTHQMITTSFMARMIISHPVERFVSLLTLSYISDSTTFRGS